MSEVQFEGRTRPVRLSYTEEPTLFPVISAQAGGEVRGTHGLFLLYYPKVG